jgi:carbon-monoxide dehydrogenase large subunit
MNAVVDALSEFDIRHIEMPATPQRLWLAIHEAKAKAGRTARHGTTPQ